MNFAQLDMFYEGLLSMSPKGVWLPFSEVVHMAQGHSWSLEGCKVAAVCRCWLVALLVVFVSRFFEHFFALISLNHGIR